MLSFMKWTKDTHNGPPGDAILDQLIKHAKDIGATHCEVATVIGRPNFAEQSKRWADKIHAAGLNVTWRNAHQSMEFTRNGDGSFSGLYGTEAWIGGRRKDPQIYLDEAKKMIVDHPDWYKDGDEFAIYPERTEGIFSDNTAWLGPNTPDNYGAFFKKLKDVADAAFTQIGKKVTTGLAANNGSEPLNGWLPVDMIKYMKVAVMDHYLDNKDPNVYEADIRKVNQRYGVPVYIQEWAFNRGASNEAQDTPVIRAYYAMFKKLADEGLLYGLGYWGGWSANGEGIFDKAGDQLVLNWKGKLLAEFFKNAPAPTPLPTPEPTPTPQPTPEGERIISAEGVSTIIVVTNKGNLWKYANKKWTKLPTPEF